tara:strand:+ start:2856 stop:3050 length:195 start_codon:yes stop_codon:yes gene_type:complete
MSDDETLEIISDEEEDYSYSSNGEDEDETCYYCDKELEYEDNEFYIEAKHCYCCERCWNEIYED